MKKPKEECYRYYIKNFSNTPDEAFEAHIEAVTKDQKKKFIKVKDTFIVDLTREKAEALKKLLYADFIVGSFSIQEQ